PLRDQHPYVRRARPRRRGRNREYARELHELSPVRDLRNAPHRRRRDNDAFRPHLRLDTPPHHGRSTGTCRGQDRVIHPYPPASPPSHLPSNRARNASSIRSPLIGLQPWSARRRNSPTSPGSAAPRSSAPRRPSATTATPSCGWPSRGRSPSSPPTAA